MARYTGPKDRLSRREGVDLFGKGPKLTRLTIPPGMHGQKGYYKKSQFARQLREKQKVRRIYGILEKQFSNYVRKALSTKGNTSDELFSLLERRLDNVVYRLGFAPTRPAARQLVSHRQIFVNNQKVNIPSFLTSEGDLITMTQKGFEIPAIKKTSEQKDYKLPDWLKRKALVGIITRMPKFEDVLEPVSAQDIIEFYSR